MRRAMVYSGLTILGLIAGGFVSCGRAESQIPGPDAPAPVVQVFARGTAPDDITGRLQVKVGDESQAVEIEDPSEVVMAKVTLEPGASVGWHSHPGPAIVVIASGELTIVRASDCARFTYREGQSFIDPGHGNEHIAFNASESDQTVVHVAYLEVPEGAGPTLPAEAPDC